MINKEENKIKYMIIYMCIYIYRENNSNYMRHNKLRLKIKCLKKNNSIILFYINYYHVIINVL